MIYYINRIFYVNSVEESKVYFLTDKMRLQLSFRLMWSELYQHF